MKQYVSNVRVRQSCLPQVWKENKYVGESLALLTYKDRYWVDIDARVSWELYLRKYAHTYMYLIRSGWQREGEAAMRTFSFKLKRQRAPHICWLPDSTPTKLNQADISLLL